ATSGRSENEYNRTTGNHKNTWALYARARRSVLENMTERGYDYPIQVRNRADGGRTRSLGRPRRSNGEVEDELRYLHPAPLSAIVGNDAANGGRNMNPTALDILKEGGTITFADGYGFTGDPATGYLFIGHEEVGHLATWHLDKVGLDNAFGQL